MTFDNDPMVVFLLFTLFNKSFHRYHAHTYINIIHWAYLFVTFNLRNSVRKITFDHQYRLFNFICCFCAIFLFDRFFEQVERLLFFLIFFLFVFRCMFIVDFFFSKCFTDPSTNQKTKLASITFYALLSRMKLAWTYLHIRT